MVRCSCDCDLVDNAVSVTSFVDHFQCIYYDKFLRFSFADYRQSLACSAAFSLAIDLGWNVLNAVNFHCSIWLGSDDESVSNHVMILEMWTRWRDSFYDDDDVESSMNVAIFRNRRNMLSL